MSRKQVAWAKAHSWYISDHCIMGNCRVVVWDIDAKRTRQRTFSDFETLKEWAGY